MNFNFSLIFSIDISADIRLKYGLDRTGWLPSQGKVIVYYLSSKIKKKFRNVDESL